MTDQDPPDHSSFREEGSADAPKEPASHETRADRSPHELDYAPILPSHSAQPLPLNYARPSHYRREGHPVVSFILGMISGVVVPSLCLCTGRGGPPWVLLLLAFVGFPLFLLFNRGTRMFGAGWLTMLATGWLALAAICGGMNFR